LSRWIVLGEIGEDTDAPAPLGLRERGKRKSTCCRSSNYFDELPPSHSEPR
jgi:hypothetical protein